MSAVLNNEIEKSDMKSNNNMAENNCSEETTVQKTESSQVKLSELRVIDLKIQLENRDLDKTGVKSALIERLKNALLEEGKDPEEYVFDIPIDSTPSKTSLKKKKIVTPEKNEDSDSIQEENGSEVALQLSVDDEEAQFNEEENIVDESLKSDVDVSLKSDVDVSLKSNVDETAESKVNSEVLEPSSSDNAASPAANNASSPAANNASSPILEVVEKVILEKSADSDEIENVSEKVTKVESPTKSIPSEPAVAVVPKASKVVGKIDKTKQVPLTAKCLCVTGLANTTRAADLKALFTKQGRVLSVKIVKSAKQVPGKCYGFVTMATSKDASKAIQNLHRTELNGRIISVERTQTDTNALLKKSDSKLATLAIKKQIAALSVLVAKQSTESNKTSSTPEVKEATKPKEPIKGSKTKSASHVLKKSEGVKRENVNKNKEKEEENKGKELDKTKGKEQDKNKEKEGDKNKGKEGEKSKGKDAEKVKAKEKRNDSQSHKDNRNYPARRPLNSSRPFSFNDRSRYNSFRRPFGRPSYSARPNFRTRDPAPASNYRMRSNLSFDRIREERLQREQFRLEADRRRALDLSRSRFVEREEAERLRDAELLRHRMVERKQKEEALRLEREKERLQLERELLERERAELLRMEREKQRLERERIEREREELRRQTELRLSNTSNKRPFSRVDRDPEPIWESKKRAVAPRYESRIASFPQAAPSTPRYELPQRERTSFNRPQNVDRPTRYTNQKAVARSPPRYGNQKPVSRSPPRYGNQKPVLRSPPRYGNQKPLSRSPPRYSNQKPLSRSPLEPSPRSSFIDRGPRREVTIRSKDNRQIYERNDFRDRDNRRSIPSPRERERPAIQRRDSPRDDWKHERRVRERDVAPSINNSGSRRMNYF